MINFIKKNGKEFSLEFLANLWTAISCALILKLISYHVPEISFSVSTSKGFLYVWTFSALSILFYVTYLKVFKATINKVAKIKGNK